jgi:hypothetical protein
VKCSSGLLALGPSRLPASEGLSSELKSVGGFQLSGTVNRGSLGKLCMASYKVISSTYSIGGVHGFLRLRMDAMANAFSNFFYLWRQDLAVYQMAPLHGLPLSLGMVETLEMTRVLCEWNALLQSFNGTSNYYSGGINSTFDAAMEKCCSALSIRVIRRRETMTTIAIKACY